MPNYHVVWEMDIEGVPDAKAAAVAAWGHMRTPDSTANVFDVCRIDAPGDGTERVDLQELWEHGAIDLDPADGHKGAL